MTTDDIELLRQYAKDNSEAAFATLVERHITMVYSAACRQTNDPHLAQDVTQTVFVILARKAGSLSSKTILSGWLYQTTRFAAAAALKQNLRRQRREQEAHMESTNPDPAPDAQWEELAPVLDEAMAQLRDKDRDALVLRFFQNKSLQEVGTALGLHERAAQKRVQRSLEKLRTILTRRGLAVPATVLFAALSASPAQAVPATLSQSVISAALTNGAAASGLTAAITKGTFKLMSWAKVKTATIAAATAILAVSTTAVVVDLVTPNVIHFNGQRVTVLSEFDWDDVARQGQLAGGKIMEMDGKTVLKITGATSGVALPLLKIDKPPINAARYAIIGEVKYENVEGAGHLNLWSFFPPIQPGSPPPQYYSYTGDVGLGPAARIQGTADWRPFSLPLDRTGKTVPGVDPVVAVRPPTRLEVGIFVGSAGVVYVRELKLVQWN